MSQPRSRTTLCRQPASGHAVSMITRTGRMVAAADARRGHAAPAPTLLVQWARIGGVCGILTGASFAVASAAPTADTELVAATVMGPGFLGFSLGLYHVLRAHRRTVSVDLGLLANVAAGISLTLMLFAQLGLKRWYELQFGAGATDSPERTLDAAFQAGNGVQLGMDVAWDVFLVLGALLLAWNMWHHPRFGRILAASGMVIAISLIVINLAVFPEPPGHDAIDLGPVIGLWYTIVSIRLVMSGHWAADHAPSHV